MQSATNTKRVEPAEIPLSKIEPHPANPRDTINQIDTERLATSMSREGQLQRAVVRPLDDGKYQLIAGSRRYAAAKAANLKTLAVDVRHNVTDEDAVAMMVVENLREFRRDFHPIENARALRLLTTPVGEGGAGKSVKEVAAMLGKSPGVINRHLRLLKLTEPWRSRVARREINTKCGDAIVPHLDRPEVLAAIEDDFQRNPDEFSTDVRFVKRVAFIAEQFGVLSKEAQRAKRQKEHDPAELAGKTIDTKRAIARFFGVTKAAVDYWCKKGAPIVSGEPNDLGEIAAWVQQNTRPPAGADDAEDDARRQRILAGGDATGDAAANDAGDNDTRDDAARSAADKKRRAAPVRLVDGGPKPEPQTLLSYGDLVALIEPYADDPPTLRMIRDHINELLESSAKGALSDAT